MGKSKSKDSKAVASTPLAVKNGGVTKSSQAPKIKSKELAKSAAKKLISEKDLKKKKKAKEPESSDDSSADSENESEPDSDSDSSESDSSESEAEKPVTKKGSTNGKTKKVESSDSDSSDSDEDSDSDEEMANGNGVKLNGHSKAAAESSDSDSDSESDDNKPAKKVNGQAKDVASSDNSDSEDDSDSDSSDSDSDDEAEADEAEAPSKKRKAEQEVDQTPKKAKTDAATTLFAGSLSWGVDDNALYEAFKDFEGITNARVVTDKNSGRSRGFGYVDFADAESATKAYEAMQGQEVDGRALNLDYANAKPAEATPRDRAANRAQKHGDSFSPESDTLFVGNLPFDVDQDSVREFFGEVREVASVRLPTDPDSGNLKGFGYVSFNSIEDAKAVLEQLNGAPIGNGRMSRSVRLDYASGRPNREGGGGGGGFGGRGGGRGGFGGRGGRGGGGFGGRGGGDRGRGGRGGGRGGFGGSRGGSNFTGTKMTFD